MCTGTWRCVDHWWSDVARWCFPEDLLSLTNCCHCCGFAVFEDIGTLGAQHWLVLPRLAGSLSRLLLLLVLTSFRFPSVLLFLLHGQFTCWHYLFFTCTRCCIMTQSSSSRLSLMICIRNVQSSSLNCYRLPVWVCWRLMYPCVG